MPFQRGTYVYGLKPKWRNIKSNLGSSSRLHNPKKFRLFHLFPAARILIMCAESRISERSKSGNYVGLFAVDSLRRVSSAETQVQSHVTVAWRQCVTALQYILHSALWVILLFCEAGRAENGNKSRLSVYLRLFSGLLSTFFTIGLARKRKKISMQVQKSLLLPFAHNLAVRREKVASFLWATFSLCYCVEEFRFCKSTE